MIIPALFKPKHIVLIPALIKRSKGQSAGSAPLSHKYLWKEPLGNNEWDYIYPEDLAAMKAKGSPEETQRFQSNPKYEEHSKRIKALEELKLNNPAKYEQQKIKDAKEKESKYGKFKEELAQARAEHGIDANTPTEWMVDETTGEDGVSKKTLSPVRRHGEVPTDRRGVKMLPGDEVKFDASRSAHYLSSEKDEQGNYTTPFGNKEASAIYLGQKDGDPDTSVLLQSVGTRSSRIYAPNDAIRHHTTSAETTSTKRAAANADRKAEYSKKMDLISQEFGSVEKFLSNPETQDIISKLQNRSTKVFHLSAEERDALKTSITNHLIKEGGSQLERIQRESSGEARGTTGRALTRHQKDLFDHLGRIRNYTLASINKDVVAAKYGNDKFTAADTKLVLDYMDMMDNFLSGKGDKSPEEKAEAWRKKEIESYEHNIKTHKHAIDKAFSDIDTNIPAKERQERIQNFKDRIKKNEESIERAKQPGYTHEIAKKLNRAEALMGLKTRVDLDAFSAGERNLELAGGMKQEGSGGKHAIENFKDKMTDIRKIMSKVLNEDQIQEFVEYTNALDSASTGVEPSEETKMAMSKLSYDDMEKLRELITPEDYYDAEEVNL